MSIGQKTVSDALSSFVTVLAIYLSANNPQAGAILLALRAGIPMLLVGWWIFRSDSNRWRAYILAVFYLAAAAWLGAAGSCASLLIFALYENLTGKPVPLDRVGPIIEVMIGGILVTMVIGLLASIGAYFARVKIWINPRIRTLSQNIWHNVPRLAVTPLNANYAMFVVATSVAGPFLLMLYLLLVALIGVKGPLVYAVLVAALGIPIAIVIAYIWFSKNIIAEKPSDCWNDQVV